MIQNLYVKNFVLIDELNLDFHSSFSSFTGETGAGKSLFIDALSILCGARVNSSYIQKGAEKAFIEATVNLPQDHPGIKKLEEAGFSLDDDYIIISREFNIEGKSIARINNRTTTVSLIKEVMGDVIDIHSQHDSQYLLDSKNHLMLLDRFVGEETLVNQVIDLYKNYRNLQKELDVLMNEEFSLDDLEFYKYQLEEIVSFDLKENEVEELELVQKEMSSFEKVSSKLNAAISILESSGYAKVYEAQKELEDLDSSTVTGIKEEFLNAYYLIDENLIALKEYANTLEYDEEKFNYVQTRLYDIQKLMRKHGHTYEDVIKKKEEMEEKIAAMENRDGYIADKQRQIDYAYENYTTAASKLSEKRKSASIKLEKQVQKELYDLHLQNAQFHVHFELEDSKTGIDKVEFYISMNKGEDPKPLTKVISGGELSRLMLGLKSIFSKLQNIQTIIFDEIDTGVSGNVAYAIGKKMRQLANDTQVFSITHLAPVAAWGNYHYLVEKEEKNGRTVSRIRQLSEEERIIELAAISSNSSSTQALDAAKELYQSTQSDNA
ncbi:DNA repair protein RecN [Breznakia pachnodae]|uniref:DNA repair protein RecN n=1 Tax=Breznakia pachnodae TaxID=265178 RepID=A0ABU0E803_9FIRM|nr:DNA repair protein RecN [Breznakia pachnodae]MDQ0362839.1 DNA repair protein RecN (Recombination protein N) [Breznakia pachnodae]